MRTRCAAAAKVQAARRGSLTTSSKTTAMTAPASKGDDCSYSQRTAYGGGDADRFENRRDNIVHVAELTPHPPTLPNPLGPAHNERVPRPA